MATSNHAAQYFALFLMIPGTYGAFQVSNAWMANIAARPRKKRGITLAMNNAFGNTALTWTPYLYPERDGPRYIMAWSVNLALSVVVFVVTVVLSLALRRDNKKLDREEDFAGATQEDTEKAASSTMVERFDEGPTAGRRLGGVRLGATARYQV